MAGFFLFFDGFWLAGFVVWKEKREGGASEMQTPEESDGRTGKKCGMDGTQTGVDRVELSSHQL